MGGNEMSTQEQELSLREQVSSFGNKLLAQLFETNQAEVEKEGNFTERQLQEMLVLLEEKKQEYHDKLSLIPMVQLTKMVEETVESDAKLSAYMEEALGIKRDKPRSMLRRLVKDQLIEVILVAEEIPASYTEDLFDEYKFSNRPSFRVFKFSSPGKELGADFPKRYREACEEINNKKNEVHRIHTKGYKFISIESLEEYPEIHELRMTYQYRIDYIDPENGDAASVYGLAYSFLWLDLVSGMSVINAKHESAIRDMQQMLRVAMEQVVQDIRFTEGLIERIAKMDYIQRANLISSNPQSANDPLYVSMSHPGLMHLPQFNELLQRANYELVSGYYKIPLEDEDQNIGEYGLGVSARKGKLWFPNHLSNKLIRRWGVGILRRLSSEIDEIRDRNFAAFAEIVNLDTNPISATIHMETRREVMNQFVKNAFSLVYQEKQHDYLKETNSLELIGKGKGFFFPPRLFAKCDCGKESFIPCPRCENTDYKAKGGVIYCDNCDQPMADQLIREYGCPDCGKTGLVGSVSEALFLYPNAKTYDYLWQQFEHMQSLENALTYDQNELFWVYQNQIWRKSVPLDVEIPPTALNHFRQLTPLDEIGAKELEETLRFLKVARGKCPFYETVDDCIGCQRSLTRQNCIQRLLIDTARGAIFNHVDLGLGDLAFEAVLAREDVKVVCYGRNGRRGRHEYGLLTPRSTEGAKLLSEMLDDHKSAAFHHFGVVTRTDLSPDMLANLKLVSRYGNKGMLLFDRDILVRLQHECLLADAFEEDLPDAN